MVETLKDVIAKLKQNSQNTQNAQSKPIQVETPAPIKQEIKVPVEFDDGEEDPNDYIDEDEENAKNNQVKTELATEDTKETAELRQILEEIELLQNNGRFRVELLHQLQEINQALVVIASAIASKNDKA